MKSWSDTLTLPQPLKAVCLVGDTSAAQAEEELQARLQASYERGRIEGQQALNEQLLSQRAEMQDLVNGVVGALRQAVSQVVRDTETAVVQLAVEVARKLVADLPISAEMIEAAVRDALGQVEGTTDIHVRLHPEDFELLRKASSELLDPHSEYKDVAFHSSSEVTRGGCIVQTRFGMFDARRETKIDLLKRSLLA